MEVNGIPIRLAALDCPERGTQKGDNATRIAKQFKGSKMTFSLEARRVELNKKEVLVAAGNLSYVAVGISGKPRNFKANLK